MTMQRARRLASVAVVASLAVMGLAGCRNSPSMAAYIGAGAHPETVTQSQIDSIYDDAQAKATGARTAADGSVQKPTKVSKQQIISAVVGLRVLRKYGADNNIKAQTFPADKVAASIFVAPDAKYVAIYSEFQGYLQAIAAKVQPGSVTEADVRDVYQRLEAGGSLPPSTTFEAFAGGLGQQDQQILAQRISLSKTLQPVAVKLNIDVNPRYTPAFSLLETQSPSGSPIAIVVVPLGTAHSTVPVTDLS